MQQNVQQNGKEGNAAEINKKLNLLTKKPNWEIWITHELNPVRSQKFGEMKKQTKTLI